jgi:hypothetical protein
MKGYTAALIILAFCQMYPQTELTNHPDEAGMVRQPFNSKTDIVHFAAAEVKPEFPGGEKAFQNFVSDKVLVPDIPELKIDTTLRVYVGFVVERDGLLSDVKILKDPGYGLGEQVVAAVKKSPRWKPGEFKANTVRVQYTLPVNINVRGYERATQPEQTGIIYTTKEVDEQPSYTATGSAGFAADINKNIDPSKLIGLTPGAYQVPVTFVIESDGSASNITASSKYSALNEEVVRAIATLKKWKPGMIKGKSVRTKIQYKIKINFTKL